MKKEKYILKTLAEEEPEFYCNDCNIDLYRDELIDNGFHWICPKCETADVTVKTAFIEKIANQIKKARYA